MIRPVNFAYNAETAVNNAFQVAGNAVGVQEKALIEFNEFVNLLEREGVDVTVVNDTPEPHTPDSIFPNNWISFHHDGSIILYPMYAANRRAERKPAVLEALKKKFRISRTIDLSAKEKENHFLEGTGSLVLDRENKIAFACLSPRTDPDLVVEFCKALDYRSVLFHANDQKGAPIYHTNVMMCVADRYVVACLASISEQEERQSVIRSIVLSGKELVEISFEQMNHFAGNMLQVENDQGGKLLVMSSQAYASLTEPQLKTLASFNRIIHAPLFVIEKNGGGSARCMMAEIHLPRLS